MAGIVEGDSYVGREGVDRYFAMLSDTWEEFRMVSGEVRDLGERPVVARASRGTRARKRGAG